MVPVTELKESFFAEIDKGAVRLVASCVLWR